MQEWTSPSLPQTTRTSFSLHLSSSMPTLSSALPSLMQTLIENAPLPFRAAPGELVEGTVVFKGKNKVLVDIRGVAIGIIAGRELRDSFNTFRRLQVGDSVTALVLEEENEEGLVILSLRMASQLKAWERLHQIMSQNETMPFTAQEANKGGLLSNIDGIRAFLPVSQLAPLNYPRVSNADVIEIMSRLQKFIGHIFTVKIITIDEAAGKIVVSERDAMSEQRARAIDNLKVGDVKDGIVSGVVKFGLFVTFNGLEGLVHISEIAWGHVRNPAEYASVGDRVTAKVIGIDGEKLSLSIKQLTQDPWEEVAERYPLGKRVQGTIVRFTDYGAFLKLEKDINGLVHLSEIAHHKLTDPSEILTIGQKVEAQVINVDIDERRIGLSIKALKPIDKATMERLKKEREEEVKRKAEEEERKKAEAANKAEAQKLQEEVEGAKPAEGTSRFVASKAGKKYYSIDAPQAKKIKEENRVYFTNDEEAKCSGRSKSASAGTSPPDPQLHPRGT